MTVAIQPTSNSTQSRDNANPVNANLHFSVSEALAESRLLERVREFRRLSLEVASVNSELSEQELAHRAKVMLQLKEASEQFNALLSPVDVVHLQVLQELKLEQILSRYYWHTLFLANNHPEQGKYELDSLCSKLLNAKYSLSVVGFDIVNSAVEIDADDYANSEGRRFTTTELPSITPEVMSVVSPNATTAITAHESVELSLPKSASKTLQPGSLGTAISGLVTGLSALLLLVLAVSVLAPEFIQQLQALVPVESTAYRFIMLLLLVTLTTSFYFMITRLTKAGSTVATSIVNKETRRFTDLIDFNASRARKFAGFIAPILFGLGLGVATSAGFGSFGFAMLVESLQKALLAPTWLVIPILTIGFGLLAWLWGRVPFGFGTLTSMLLVAPAIGVGVGFGPVDATFAGNVVALLLGLVLFSGGISLAAAAAQGPDVVTTLSLAAERVHQCPISLSVVLWDLTAIAAGVILGGTVGIATIVGLIAVPFLIRFFLPAFRRVLI